MQPDHEAQGTDFQGLGSKPERRNVHQVLADLERRPDEAAHNNEDAEMLLGSNLHDPDCSTV